MARDELREIYPLVRSQTRELCEPLEVEDQVVQTMPDVSPTKWHLAHTSWFFETFVLQRALSGYRPFDERYGWLFNSYYNGIGAFYPRPQRGHLTRPTVAEVNRYRRHVDEAMGRLLENGSGDLSEDLAFAIELGLNHEEQHQELILTDIKHVLSANRPPTPYRPPLESATRGAARGISSSSPSQASPIAPARGAGSCALDGTHPAPASATAASGRSTVAGAPWGWRSFPGGLIEVGHAGRAFSFDNERPRHSVYLEPFQIASRVVTCGEFAEFMRDGGYERADLWLSDGWDARKRHGWECPLYWSSERGACAVFTLRGTKDMDPQEPVCHVSYYEADAFARWAGARLPREEEWEVAAAAQAKEQEVARAAEAMEMDRGSRSERGRAGEPPAGHFLESGRLHPAGAAHIPDDGRSLAARPHERPRSPREGVAVDRDGTRRDDAEPAPADGAQGRVEMLQLFGDVWEWTSSPYVAYPGFQSFAGTLGEYNGKFMCNQMVLRGGSCATPRRHIRPTYRNFFPPEARWQFTGIRLARPA